jgi:hypothetical protein
MTVKRTEQWVHLATPDEVSRARANGEIPDELLPFISHVPVLQRTAGWVSTATAQQISDAYRAGELAEYAATPNEDSRRAPIEPTNPDGRVVLQRGAAWVAAATPQQIVDAERNGELVEYLGGTVNELGNRVDARGHVLHSGRVA